ncbi:MAG: DedA family protein [Anaerolineaceae bacterium]
MQFIQTVIDLFLHLDKHLGELIQQIGIWTYLPLFFVVFMETGFVVTPFLPGDSLIFAAGTLAALPESPLNIVVLFLILAAAAILGDTVNYWIGHYIGPRVFTEKIPFLKKEYLDRTHQFYERHGGITIFLARFIPIIRTFAPFVAGVGAMTYGHFIIYNIMGGLVWTALFSFGGFFFGNLEIVRNHFSLVIVAIILISVLPVFIEIIKGRINKRKQGKPTLVDK